MDNWMNHPGLKDIDPLKLELIKRTMKQTEGKSGNALASVLFGIVTSANKQGIKFSADEIALIIEIMKEGKSEKEITQMDKIVNMVNGMMKNKK